MTDPEFPPTNTSMFSSDFTDSNTVAIRRETVSGSAWSLQSPVFMARVSKCLITRPVSSSNFGFQRQPASLGWRCRIGTGARPGSQAAGVAMAEIIILAERRKARQERRATNVMAMSLALLAAYMVLGAAVYAAIVEASQQGYER